jgi:RNA polymerase sigma factor (sigma-70 family)
VPVPRAAQDLSVSELSESFDAHRSQIAAFLRARCRGWADESEVEDILQELWIRVRNVEAAKVGDAKSYLYRAAHNLMLDRARRTKTRTHYETDWSYSQGKGTGEAEPERKLLAKERLRAVDRTLRQLGERAAFIFKRYRLDGVDQKHIAAELRVSLSTVEKDLRKSYVALIALQEDQDDV